MGKIRITGIVKLANRVRRVISASISAERLQHLQETVNHSLQTIDKLLAEAGTTADTLPAPSRKAYQFLATLDFKSIATADTAHSSNFTLGSVSFKGLRSCFKGILDQLALSDGEIQLRDHYKYICASSQNIENHIHEGHLAPEQLTPESRDIRGWLAYFSQRQHFDAYVAAFRGAGPIFREALRHTGKLSGKVLMHFRPMKSLYRLRGTKNLALIQMPTPMICFEKETFQTLACLLVRKSLSKEAVVEAMLSESYQKILSELDLLAGITENSAGAFHDLAESFDRVNNTYFKGDMARPCLLWSQSFTFRKFGHYDLTHDTVMVSSSLDHKEIPEYAVDFLVYHELLHKKLGTVWNNGRRAVHTAAFRREEQHFRQYHEAKTILTKLARQHTNESTILKT
jgi:hypothetical protein